MNDPELSLYDLWLADQQGEDQDRRDSPSAADPVGHQELEARPVNDDWEWEQEDTFRYLLPVAVAGEDRSVWNKQWRPHPGHDGWTVQNWHKWKKIQARLTADAFLGTPTAWNAHRPPKPKDFYGTFQRMALRLASTAYPRDPERWGYRLEDWYDLSQDVLAHLWAKQVDPTDSEAERWLVDSFDGKAKYSTWAYQVASNLVKDHIKAQRSAARDPNHGIEEDSDHRIQMVDTSQIDLAVPVDDLDLRLDLEQAISQLSPQERLVIEHDLEDRQGETGLSNPSVYRTAAHKKLRVLLSEYA